MERFNIFLEFKVKADLHYAAPWHFLSNTEEQGHCFLIHLNPWHFCVTLSNIHALLFPLYPMKQLSSVQFIRSVVSDLYDPMNRRTPGLPVHHQLPDFTQTHIHRVSDAIQPSHPLSSPSPPAPNPSQPFPMSQLFARGGQSTEVSALALFLPKNTQGWSPSEWTGWISLQSKGLSRVFSNTTVQRHQFKQLRGGPI